MGACGFMADLDQKAEKDKLYTRCLQVNHPTHHGNNYARWNARGTICSLLVDKYDAPVWYRQDVANETDAALNQTDCVSTRAVQESALLMELKSNSMPG